MVVHQTMTYSTFQKESIYIYLFVQELNKPCTGILNSEIRVKYKSLLQNNTLKTHHHIPPCSHNPA